MKFQIPQFVEVEDKLFWKLTLKQFIYLAGGGGICIMIWQLLPIKFLAIILILPVAAFALALAFYKFNNRPFIIVVEAASKYFLTPKLYIWRKVEEPILHPEEKEQKSALDLIPKLSSSKLGELSWSLGVKNSENAENPISTDKK